MSAYEESEIERIVADWSQCDQLDKMIKRIALYSAPDKDGWYDKYAVRVVNDVFEMHPYCWGSEPEHPDGSPEWRDDDDDPPLSCPLCNETLPNFWHKPSGLKVWWYKYIGRGREILPVKYDPEQLGQIERDCIKSLSQK